MRPPLLSSLIDIITITRRANRPRANGGFSSMANAPDFSYEDTLFDAELRAFFRSEYGQDEPPEGVSDQVARAIRRYNEEQAARATEGMKGALVRAVRKLAQLPGAIYRFSSRPDTTRLLSGSLLTALIVMAMAPKIVQTLDGRSMSSLYTPQRSSRAEMTNTVVSRQPEADSSLIAPTMEPAPQVLYGLTPEQKSEQARQLLEQRTGEDFDAPPQAELEDDTILHPFEMGIARDGTSRQKPTSPYRRTFGSQE